VLECSFFNAFIPCIVLPAVLLVAPEYQRWGDHLGGRNAANSLGVAGLLLTICLAKYVDRVSKFTVVSKASTMFYAVVDSNMKLIAGIGTIVFFRESLTWGQVTGFFIIFMSLIVSLYDKKVKVAREVAAAMAAEVVK
jgi:drug/metabolite transporter (DMT)-like permease